MRKPQVEFKDAQKLFALLDAVRVEPITPDNVSLEVPEPFTETTQFRTDRTKVDVEFRHLRKLC